MRVAIVGSRKYRNPEEVVKFVEALPEDCTVVSGHGGIVDLTAENTANKRGLPTLIFPAQWNRYGKKAGFLRNEDIVANADVVVAFWDGESRGTRHSMGLAKYVGIPLYVKTPDTEMQEQ